jgi:hypothetical protein
MGVRSRFPIVLKDRAELELAHPVYYQVAANGLFLVRDTPLYRATTRVTTGVPGLHPSREELVVRFPPLPVALVEPILAFFREVYERWTGEAIVLLFLCPESGEYRALVPPQEIPGYRDAWGRPRAYLRLRYGSVARPEGFVRFGSIHSHAELPAGASCTDLEDEEHGDGLHVVYGRIDRDAPARSAACVVSGRRFDLEPELVVPECRVPDTPAPREWLEQVSFVEKSGGGLSWPAAVGETGHDDAAG